MISIANPLYDTVFKFLMDDTKVAQILIGALIKQKVHSIRQTANEFVQISADGLKLLRLDFSADVETADGSIEVVTIEIQKVFLESEIVRFRKYLGAQYSEKANYVVHEKVVGSNGKTIIKKRELARPITSIYILGHSTIDDSHPIIYGEQQYTDVEGNPIQGISDTKFLTSLTHRIIIVQVPSLSPKPKTYVEKLLSIFDQSYVTEKTSHIINIEKQDDSADYNTIINRLILATADVNLRKEMECEADGIMEFEGMWNRLDFAETELTFVNEQLSQQKEQLSKKDEQLSQQKVQLSQQQEQLSQQKEQMAKMIKLLASMSMPIEQIAKQTNLTEDYVREILKG